ncbi:MAG: hypothetical protein ACI841_004853 [Planctomycetota bacterium]
MKGSCWMLGEIDCSLGSCDLSAEPLAARRGANSRRSSSSEEQGRVTHRINRSDHR